MSMEKYVKFYQQVKEWYDKKTSMHQCVVCQFYNGVFKDNEICEEGFCRLEQKDKNYKESCHSFKPKPLGDFIDIYFN